MLAKVISGATVGLDAVPVEVEVDIAAQGLPAFSIVGLADRAIEEAKERVRSAIKNTGADFPAKRITVNLAPADLPKVGPVFDLPIAVGLLIASGQLEVDLKKTLMLGELSLDGSLKSTNGVLPLITLAKDQGFTRVLLPNSNAEEAAVVDGVQIYPFENLLEVFQFLSGTLEVTPQPATKIKIDEDELGEYDFKDIKGQEHAKRALEIAAAGGHNILLKGPPGAGKTMLARSFPSILPVLSKQEILEVTKIYSISGKLSKDKPIVTTRPFRSPHHTASHIGVIGGGNNIKPGEVSLAHRGVLFLDELAEFPRTVLEALRQPLEDKQVSISRASGSLTFPSQFILFAASNPCPCGFLGTVSKVSTLTKRCVCMPGQISRYQKKLSGPLLDRIDIHLEVPAVEVDKLTGLDQAESSSEIKKRVAKARQVQRDRFKQLKILTNSEMTSSQIKNYCQLSDESLELLKMAISKMGLSARGYHRVIKLARTIADLSLSKEIETEHIAEALSFRATEES